MSLQLTKNEVYLLELLRPQPLDFDSAATYLNQFPMSHESITKVAIHYAEECFLDAADPVGTNTDERQILGKLSIPAFPIPNRHNTYIYDVAQFLLGYGLDPNTIFVDGMNQYNLMDDLLHIDNEYLAADTMALLMEHGGDPNLVIDGEPLFAQVDFDVWFDAIEQAIRWRYDSLVHIWMVLLAYGGKQLNGELPDMQVFPIYDSCELFDINKLREHRKYQFCLSKEGTQTTLHIYDKNTFWEVARF